MSQTIWWWLAREFHTEPNVGHSPGKARDCYECKRIAKVFRVATI